MLDETDTGLNSHTLMDLNQLEVPGTSQPLLQVTRERQKQLAKACQHIQAGMIYWSSQVPQTTRCVTLPRMYTL